jgi:hypothetical protein
LGIHQFWVVRATTAWVEPSTTTLAPDLTLSTGVTMRVLGVGHFASHAVDQAVYKSLYSLPYLPDD